MLKLTHMYIYIYKDTCLFTPQAPFVDAYSAYIYYVYKL